MKVNMKHAAAEKCSVVRGANKGIRLKTVQQLVAQGRIPSEKIRNELGNMDTLTEDKLDAILEKFMNDLKENALEANGWSLMLPSCSILKATLNAHTRVLAKKYPEMRINCPSTLS